LYVVIDVVNKRTLCVECECFKSIRYEVKCNDID